MGALLLLGRLGVGLVGGGLVGWRLGLLRFRNLGRYFGFGRRLLGCGFLRGCLAASASAGTSSAGSFAL